MRLKKLKKRLLMILVVIAALIGILVATIFLTLRFNPQFGGEISEEYKEQYRGSSNYRDDQFVNVKSFPSHMDFNFKDFKEGISEMISPSTVVRPENWLPVVDLDPKEISQYKGETRVVWFGHSSIFIQMEGKNILIDPVFSRVTSPISWIGRSRFSESMPIEIEDLPAIDYILISHDHYDHLDYNAIVKLKSKVKKFYTPLGVGAHLERWGVEIDRIVELDWWDSVDEKDIIFTALPAQHFSGRRPNDRNFTLWCSWGIKSDNSKIYFSGDSGYSEHFKEIGEKCGPYDLAFVECGQYNEKWPNIHMFPEESAKAGRDLGAEVIIPIHWGAFSLAMHDWFEPVERVLVEAKKLEQLVEIPKIGEVVSLPLESGGDIDMWWRKFK